MERDYRPDEHPYAELLKLVRAGRRAVLATVVRTEGSSPQVAGASALFTDDGLDCGTVGGGTVEAETARLAKAALRRRDLPPGEIRPFGRELRRRRRNLRRGDDPPRRRPSRPERRGSGPARIGRSPQGDGRLGRRSSTAIRGGRIDSIVRRWIPARAATAAPPSPAFPGFAAALARGPGREPARDGIADGTAPPLSRTPRPSAAPHCCRRRPRRPGGRASRGVPRFRGRRHRRQAGVRQPRPLSRSGPDHRRRSGARLAALPLLAGRPCRHRDPRSPRRRRSALGHASGGGRRTWG